MKIILVTFFLSVLLFGDMQGVTLQESIKIALKNNQQRKISAVGLEIAQAQYEQALSANYPIINAMISGQRLKQDQIFQQRSRFDLPSEMTKLLALSNTLTIPDQAARLEAQKSLGATPINAFPTTTIPANIDSDLYGKDTVKGTLSIAYPLYTGGKITSIIEQAKLNKLLAKNKIIRDKNSVIFDIKKYFYGYVLTNELHKIANSTFKRMEFIEEMTKQFYESGESLNVKKTDYLEVKITVRFIESLVAKLKQCKLMAKSALMNTMGLPWDSDIALDYSNQTLLPPNYILADLVKEAYTTNSDINKIDIALKISSQKIKEAKSGHYPTVGLKADISKIYNSYDYGLINKEHREPWSVGFMVDIPIFDGFRTTNKVTQTKLENKKMYLIRDMLKEGVALLIKNEFTKASIGFKQIQTLKKARKIAIQNRKLNIKGFQIDAIKPEKVIQAQYIEAYTKADHLKYVHDYLLSLATIDKLIGKELKIK